MSIWGTHWCKHSENCYIRQIWYCITMKILMHYAIWDFVHKSLQTKLVPACCHALWGFHLYFCPITQYLHDITTWYEIFQHTSSDHVWLLWLSFLDFASLVLILCGLCFPVLWACNVAFWYLLTAPSDYPGERVLGVRNVGGPREVCLWWGDSLVTFF